MVTKSVNKQHSIPQEKLDLARRRLSLARPIVQAFNRKWVPILDQHKGLLARDFNKLFPDYQIELSIMGKDIAKICQKVGI